ncbi:MAG: hypothetical protein JOZ42_02315 [Acetobacteraceae bacterium]|nr:hypothetical protein [Acetobacteraceae bacterium]
MTDALAQGVSKVQAAGAEAVKTVSEWVTPAPKQPAESGAELVAHVAADAARAQSEAVHKFEAVTASASDGAAGLAAKAADEGAKVAEQAGETGRVAAETGRKVVQESTRLAADWQKQFSGWVAGQHFMGTTSRVADIYRGASEQTSANARALASTYAQLGRGMQNLQKTYVELLERASRRAASRPLDFMRCKSAEDFARVQRDMYVDSLNYSLEATGTLLEAAGAIAQEALASLQDRGRRSA